MAYKNTNSFALWAPSLFRSYAIILWLTLAPYHYKNTILILFGSSSDDNTFLEMVSYFEYLFSWQPTFLILYRLLSSVVFVFVKHLKRMERNVSYFFIIYFLCLYSFISLSLSLCLSVYLSPSLSIYLSLMSVSISIAVTIYDWLNRILFILIRSFVW